MRRWLTGLRMVINRPPCDEDFDSAGSRSEPVFVPGLHRELLQLLPFSLAFRINESKQTLLFSPKSSRDVKIGDLFGIRTVAIS